MPLVHSYLHGITLQKSDAEMQIPWAELASEIRYEYTVTATQFHTTFRTTTCAFVLMDVTQRNALG